jgi:hypothetical protein
VLVQEHGTQLGEPLGRVFELAEDDQTLVDRHEGHGGEEQLPRRTVFIEPLCTRPMRTASALMSAMRRASGDNPTATRAHAKEPEDASR